MGLMDKLKETAQEVADEARKATVQGKGKLEELALRRRMDESARKLGYLVFRERTQGTPSGTEADGLIADMRELEDQIARSALETAQPAEAAAQTSTEPEAAGHETSEKTQPGAAPAQSPPEGSPTDQPKA
jgi:ATP-dependent DNA ligase